MRNQLNKHRPRYKRIPEGRPGHRSGTETHVQLKTKGKAQVGVKRLVGQSETMLGKQKRASGIKGGGKKEQM